MLKKVYIVTILNASGEENVSYEHIKNCVFSNREDAENYRNNISYRIFKMYKDKERYGYNLDKDLDINKNIDEDNDEDNAKYADIDVRKNCTYITRNTNEIKSLYSVISIKEVIIDEHS